jgi:transcriptional regulator with XRE-family HTH domain
MASIDDKKFLRDLGKRLRDQREARGLTQAQMAEKCGLHRTFIGSVERGERNISVLNLRLMARILRVTLSALWE